MKKNPKRLRIVASNDERGPTPETRAHLERDPILELHKLGVLTDAERAAAERIREIHDAAHSVGAIDYREWVTSGQRGRPIHPLDGMSPDQQREYTRSYVPWCARARRGWVIEALSTASLWAAVENLKQALRDYGR